MCSSDLSSSNFAEEGKLLDVKIDGKDIEDKHIKNLKNKSEKELPLEIKSDEIYNISIIRDKEIKLIQENEEYKIKLDKNCVNKDLELEVMISTQEGKIVETKTVSIEVKKNVKKNIFKSIFKLWR